MANTRILQVFQCDKRDFGGSGRIALPLAELNFFRGPGRSASLPSGLARSMAVGSCCAKPLAIRAYTVSNFSITRVSARPPRVHSLKAGNDIIASMQAGSSGHSLA